MIKHVTFQSLVTSINQTLLLATSLKLGQLTFKVWISPTFYCCFKWYKLRSLLRWLKKIFFRVASKSFYTDDHSTTHSWIELYKMTVNVIKMTPEKYFPFKHNLDIRKPIIWTMKLSQRQNCVTFFINNSDLYICTSNCTIMTLKNWH